MISYCPIFYINFTSTFIRTYSTECRQQAYLHAHRTFSSLDPIWHRISIAMPPCRKYFPQTPLLRRPHPFADPSQGTYLVRAYLPARITTVTLFLLEPSVVDTLHLALTGSLLGYLQTPSCPSLPSVLNTYSLGLRSFDSRKR